MKYMGGKTRLAKIINWFIDQERRKDQLYIEPFCGSCSILENQPNPRWANDSHYYLVELLKALQGHWVPPVNVSVEEWEWAKFHPEKHDPAYVGFCGFCCSFGSAYFRSYAKCQGQTNYALSSREPLLRLGRNLEGAKITNLSFDELNIPPGSYVYCDPPYKGTDKYRDHNMRRINFNYGKFYQWCHDVQASGCTVLVSELDMPDDFEVVHSVQMKYALNNTDNHINGSLNVTEKLWRPR